jgi:hypothetical protein
VPCSVRTDAPLREARHDGEALWANNDVSTALLRLEDPQGDPWAGWSGEWGVDGSPSAPGHGANAAHFYAPWSSDCARDNEGCPRELVGPSAVHPRSERHDVAACWSWFGGGVSAATCAPGRLGMAVAAGRLGGPGSLRLHLPPHASGKAQHASASAPGLAQALGLPLRPGQRMFLSGRAPQGTMLLVRAATSQEVVSATFRRLGLQRGGRAAVAVRRRHGRVMLTLTPPAGSRRAPSHVTRTRVAIAGAPNVRQVHRAGDLLRLSFTTPGPYTHIEATVARHGPPRTDRVVQTSRTTVQRSSIRVSPQVRYVRLTAIQPNGARSRTAILPVRARHP